MSEFVPAAIAVFARAPLPGSVKTRLARSIGPVAAAQLYGAMLRDTLRAAQSAADLLQGCQVVLAFTPHDAFAAGEYSLSPFWSGARLQQCDGDIGQRMRDCIAQLQHEGKQRVVLLGSDTPDIGAHIIADNLCLLRDYELTLCRSADGGFNLIGAAAPLPRELFDGVPWSTERTFDRVAANAAALRLKWAHSYHGHDDVDTAADLQALVQRLQTRPESAPHTWRWLRSEDLL
jgi:rSAM/selenodomain-associated transferase 1